MPNQRGRSLLFIFIIIVVVFGAFLIYQNQLKVNTQTPEYGKKVSEPGLKAETLELPPVESSVPMQEYSTQICDLNNDSKCDYSDKEVFERSLGACRIKDNNYNPIADGDIDGCVTEIDYKVLFETK